jgi:hypothetical protein
MERKKMSKKMLMMELEKEGSTQTQQEESN